MFPKHLRQSWGKSGPCLPGCAVSSFSLTPGSTAHGGNPHVLGLFCLRGSAEPCSSTRSHFEGENAEARRQSLLSQGAQPSRGSPRLEPASAGAPPLHYAAHPRPRGCTHRHEPLVLIQTLPAGRDEQASVLDPARVQPRLLLQLTAHHLPCVCQELHLHVTGPQLPQQAWRERVGGDAVSPSLRGCTPFPWQAGAPESQAEGLKRPCRPWRGPREADEQETTGATLSSSTRPLGSSERDTTKGSLHRAPAVGRAGHRVRRPWEAGGTVAQRN